MSYCNGEASVVCLSVCLSVCPSVCKLLRKSLLLADKWPDRYQTFTRCTPGQRESRVCSTSRSRSMVTWYAPFLGFLDRATPSLTVWFTCLMGLVYESRPTCLNLMAEITMSFVLLVHDRSALATLIFTSRVCWFASASLATTIITSRVCRSVIRSVILSFCPQLRS